MSGNNLSFGGDLARRTVPIRITPTVEKPELRTGFRHPDLMLWVQRHRREIVVAALTLLTAWTDAGMPYGPVVMGSFERWSKTLSGALEVAGLPGLLDNREEVADASDADTAALRGFVLAWHQEFETRTVVTGQLFELAGTLDTPPFYLGDGSDRSQRTKFGTAMKSLRDRVLAGFKVLSDGENTKTHAQQWRLEAVEQSPSRRAVIPVRCETPSLGSDIGTSPVRIGTSEEQGSDFGWDDFESEDGVLSERSEPSEPFFNSYRQKEEETEEHIENALRAQGESGSEGSEVPTRLHRCRCCGCAYCTGPARGSHSRIDLSAKMRPRGLCAGCIEQGARV